MLHCENLGLLRVKMRIPQRVEHVQPFFIVLIDDPSHKKLMQFSVENVKELMIRMKLHPAHFHVEIFFQQPLGESSFGLVHELTQPLVVNLNSAFEFWIENSVVANFAELRRIPLVVPFISLSYSGSVNETCK